MKVLVALGGNALLRRGEPMTVENQRANVAVAAMHLATVAGAHQLVVSHGNGPQIGLLALEGAAYDAVPPYPLDVLGAETQGMVGYLIEQELANRLPRDQPMATVLTMVEVDPADAAFLNPTKPIGPQYGAAEAAALATERGWEFRPDGEFMRRVVPSPVPHHIVEGDLIGRLVAAGALVICAGGGGIPVARNTQGHLYGIEAVIDKDRASCLLAVALKADVFVMATDTPAAYLGYGTPEQAAVDEADPDALVSNHAAEFAEGSMLPKVTAACEFARATDHPAVIGQLADIEGLVAGTAGTRISTEFVGVRTQAAAQGTT
jgi:carbamate kinase